MKRLLALTLTLAVAALLGFSSVASADGAADQLDAVVTHTVECGDGLYSVHFTVTVTNPTGEPWTMTPLFGASLGEQPDAQPFTHTVGPMTDQPSSLGTFSFYLNRLDDPYNPAGWTWVSVPAPGCNIEPTIVEPPIVEPPVDLPVVTAPTEPVLPVEPIVEPPIVEPSWLTSAELWLADNYATH